MSDASDTAVLDSLFEPVAQCFTPDVARRVAGLRASPEAQASLDALAEKCGEGTLTAEERGVYEAAVRAVNFIGVLQAKAQAMLANEPHGE
ncbi:MAG TPA: hypothetical protein VF278_02260 [Pirellulales bacterium]